LITFGTSGTRSWWCEMYAATISVVSLAMFASSSASASLDSSRSSAAASKVNNCSRQPVVDSQLNHGTPPWSHPACIVAHQRLQIPDYAFSDLNSCDRQEEAGHTLLGQGPVAMARALDEIVRLDRRWFWAHPERRHRCRWPDTGELDLCDSDPGARLVMAIRHLGRGHVVYQPVIFQGVLPADEESAAALFALAARSLEPIPVIAEMDVLRRGLRQQTQSDEASAMVAAKRSQQPSRRWCIAVAAARPVRGKSGRSAVGGGTQEGWSPF
jgi:hypothetical protein